MHKLLTIAILIASIFVAQSCQKETFPQKEKELIIQLISSNNTKGFFENSDIAESWELNLNSGVIFILKDNEMYLKRKLTLSELQNKKFNLPLPQINNSDEIEMYLILNNIDAENINTKAELFSAMEGQLTQYNGEFNVVTSSSARTQGFTMSGFKKIKITNDVENKVELSVTRLVSKLAIQATTTAEFATRYKGTLRINSINLAQLSNSISVISTGSGSVAKNLTLTQPSNKSNTTFQNLFYIYENVSGLTYNINATYDEDNNFATTHDQVNVIYKLTKSDQIVRNGYYRLLIHIDGLVGEKDANSSFEVKNWNTPVTLTTNVGN